MEKSVLTFHKCAFKSGLVCTQCTVSQQRNALTLGIKATSNNFLCLKENVSKIILMVLYINRMKMTCA